MFFVETYDVNHNLLESLCFSSCELLFKYLEQSLKTYSSPVFRVRKLEKCSDIFCFD